MKSLWGTFLILVICLITINLWLLAVPSIPALAESPLRSLSKIFSLIGIVLMAITLILSTRSRVVEYLFKGLDKVYSAHHILGSLSFVFLINHPLLLIAHAMPYYEVATLYFIPQGNLPYTLGIASLYIMMASFVFMIFIRVSYQSWLFSHRFLTLSFILGGFHALLATSDISASPVLRAWITLFIILGTASGLYMLIFYERLGPRFTYIVDSIVKKFEVIDVYLKPQQRKISFTPGQFVYARFLDKSLGLELHPFSMSSTSDEQALRLSIKTSGDYTRKLELLTRGTQTFIYGPYGQFGEIYAKGKNDMLWVAGGIGVTPFISMLHEEALYPQGRKIYFCYAYKAHEENVFVSELQVLLKATPNVIFLDWCSKDKGRLTAEALCENFKRPFTQGEYIMMCGPMPMMTGLEEQFELKGVADELIVFEKFSIM